MLKAVGLSTSDSGTVVAQPVSEETDGPEWVALSSDFPREFSLYVEFDTSGYSGRVVSINRDTAHEFSLSVDSVNVGGILRLTLMFPGVNSPIALDLFPEVPSGFQTIGLVLQQTVVSVYLNCVCGGLVILPEEPSDLEVTDTGVMRSEVEIFDQPANVREVKAVYAPCCTYPILILAGNLIALGSCFVHVGPLQCIAISLFFLPNAREQSLLINTFICCTVGLT